MFARSFCLLAVTSVLAACAQHPDSIAPAASPVSEARYASLSCKDLAIEQGRVGSALAQVYEQQEKAHRSDAASMFWLGLPLATIVGEDREKTVASLKGEQDALRRVAAQKTCPGATTA